MASPTRNYYTSPATDPAEIARSRQNSDVMEIYGITDRENLEHSAGDSDAANRNGSPSMSSTFSKLSQNYPPYEENGRMYHGFRKGVYMLPCDEQEQDRLDIFHKLFTEARKSDGLIYAPHPPNGRFLDLGCGTGIWAIDVAHKYPKAHVVGVDLAQIQPDNHPENCHFFAPFDFESPWAMGEESWDLIHLQMGCGSVVGWPNLYQKIFAHLAPGAWFEQVEIDFEPRCNNRPLEKLAMWHWYQYLKQATQDTMRPIAHNSHETIKQLEEAGFTQINHQIVGLPLNPWIPDKHESKVARWYNLAISESIESLSLAPFSRVFQWPVEKIRRISEEVKSEAFNPDIHAWNLLHIYQARKPLPN
ncbi:class I SAM-dependent methyltransferase [Aspergillus brunneoviolaceus CBS 621.78]|uniref:S-adenosyl-L-methionine-dependent methyltransferase n=1 Tax=Aspergillus brunneoviolaceus CBS 621.78 TaxID=1450534 RepID=A0ACD1GM13_9EURO|nr:S-adenosyl-L-methionine-dependent methyltransferase [Aspergillus brunneoviolaceus CBS 621.78]RAH50267.1 S-adenosyl-L-methionine-dependent methyltransferase [Aspergillus brunneoviolaceus CBS 621.78]